jgi:hypothetical protein
MVKRKTGEFSDKLLSLQRGLRQFQGKDGESVRAGVRMGLREGTWLFSVIFSNLTVLKGS